MDLLILSYPCLMELYARWNFWSRSHCGPRCKVWVFILTAASRIFYLSDLLGWWFIMLRSIDIPFRLTDICCGSLREIGIHADDSFCTVMI